MWRASRSSGTPPRPLRLKVELSPDAPLDLGLGHRIALSPDGSRLAFVGNAGGERYLFIRALDQPAAVKVAGTAGALQPFFSADGRSIGFFAGDELRRVPAEGGVPSFVCKASADGRGGTWGPDDTIVFVAAQNMGLQRVSAGAGTPQPLTHLPPGERSHRWPSFLPGGRRLLFNVQPGNVSFDEARVEQLDMASGKRQLLFVGGAEPRYAAGRVLFVKGGKLYAAPYDERAARLSADPVAVVNGVESDARNGGSQFTVSSEGTLAISSAREAAPTAS